MSPEELALLGRFSDNNEAWQDFANLYGEVAAAASLLPKLVLAIKNAHPTAPYHGRSVISEHVGTWWFMLGSALHRGNSAEVCRLIVEAVRRVREDKG